jgi:hypothetical protein
LHEKIKLIGIILGVVSRAVLSKPLLFTGHDSSAEVLFTTLVGLHYILDQWCSVDAPSSNLIISPQALRGKTMDLIMGLLQCLGNAPGLGQDNATTWTTLAGILLKCLGICDGAFHGGCTFFSNLTQCPEYLNSIIKPALPWRVHFFGAQTQGPDNEVFDAVRHPLRSWLQFLTVG